MNCPFNEEQLNQLKAVFDFCKTEPQIVHHPKLTFFKEYLSALGVTMPGPTPSAENFAPSGDTNTSKSNSSDNTPTSSDDKSSEDSNVEQSLQEYFDHLDDENYNFWTSFY